jgi:hypothetical protein
MLSVTVHDAPAFNSNGHDDTDARIIDVCNGV